MRHAWGRADGEDMKDTPATYSIVLGPTPKACVLGELTAPSLDEAWRIAQSRFPDMPLTLVLQED